MEGSKNNPDPQERRPRRNRELEADIDYELHVQNLYMLNGPSNPEHQLESSHLLGQSERCYKKDERLQLTRDHSEQAVTQRESEQGKFDRDGD
jgi:hypothetical protein